MCEVAALVAARGYLKASLTRLHKYIAKEEYSTASCSELMAKRDRLISAFKEYERYNIDILSKNPDDSENVGDQEDKYISTLARLNDEISSRKSSTGDEEDMPRNHTPLAHTKLPSVEIVTFTGKYYGPGHSEVPNIGRIYRFSAKESFGTGNRGRQWKPTASLFEQLCQGSRCKGLGKCVYLCSTFSSMSILSSCLKKSCIQWMLLAPTQLRVLSTRNLNILWRENPNTEIRCIQLTTVTYGLKSSSFLATRCLDELATVTQLNAYVANRIQVVAQLTAGWTWHYVSTSDNPADLITRGVSPQELADNMLWWTGPLFLQNDKLKAESSKQLMGSLPTQRVTQAHPFDKVVKT
ncbi:unnamed protein product, partial [Iphiclides podalirius]